MFYNGPVNMEASAAHCADRKVAKLSSGGNADKTRSHWCCQQRNLLHEKPGISHLLTNGAVRACVLKTRLESQLQYRHKPAKGTPNVVQLVSHYMPFPGPVEQTVVMRGLR